MNFKPLESKNSKQPADQNPFTSWGCFVGAGLGLLLTIFAGHWPSNLIGGGIVGFFIGALIDRNRSN